MLIEGFKVCTLCKDKKIIDDFNRKSSTKDGRQNVCRLCSSKVAKEHYLKNGGVRKEVIYASRIKRQKEARLFILEKLKLGCSVCPEKDPIVLEFDHISGKKKYNLSKMVSDGMSITKIENELEKCQILCANCHRRKTAKDFDWYKIGN